MPIKRQIRDTSFKGIALCKDAVQALFRYCLATDSSKDTAGYILFKKKWGFQRILNQFFDKEALNKSKRKILYLFGQLQITHNNSEIILPTNVNVSYTGEAWTNNNEIMSEFLHLGYAADAIDSFMKTSIGTNSRLYPISPTLSPKDPNFPAWWEEHKSEWETEQ